MPAKEETVNSLRPDPAEHGQQSQERAQQKQQGQQEQGPNSGQPPAAPPGSSGLEPSPGEPAPPPPPAPVTYTWGSSRTFNFRSEVRITNNTSSATQGLVIYLPMLENNSPYQETSLQSTNYPATEKNGRVARFEIGDLEPGESTTLITDYAITVRPVAINSTNNTVERARQAYQQYAGSGNCYDGDADIFLDLLMPLNQYYAYKPRDSLT